jgi:hypothetical protein
MSASYGRIGPDVNTSSEVQTMVAPMCHKWTSKPARPCMYGIHEVCSGPVAYILGPPCVTLAVQWLYAPAE